MVSSFHEVANLAAENEDNYNSMMREIDDMKMAIIHGKQQNNLFHEMTKGKNINAISDDTCNIVDPRVVHCKGRPPFKRKQSKVDQVIQKQKCKEKLSLMTKIQKPRLVINFPFAFIGLTCLFVFIFLGKRINLFVCIIINYPILCRTSK